MALIGYARVSTEDQITDRQLDELRTAGCAEGFEEHASGGDRGGSVATFGIGRKTSASWDQLPSQAASWNRSAMNAAWALMSLPPMFRTCPFLIIAIAS